MREGIKAKQTRVVELRKLLQVDGVEGAATAMQADSAGPSQRSSPALKRKGSTPASSTKGPTTRSKRARVAAPQAEPQTPAMPSREDIEKEITVLQGEIEREDHECARHYPAQMEARDSKEEAELARSRAQKELVTYCHVKRSEVSPGSTLR